MGYKQSKTYLHLIFKSKFRHKLLVNKLNEGT